MDVKEIIDEVKLNLLRNHYWYASVLMQLPIVYDDPDVPTLAVGKTRAEDTQINLFVNPDYVKEIADFCHWERQKVVGHFVEVMKHEVHHLIFGHLMLHFENQTAGEIACELSVNSYVERERLVSTIPGQKAGVFAEDFRLPSKLGVMEYYGKLAGKMGQNGQGNSQNGQSSQNGQASGQATGQGNGGENTLDSHSKWEATEGSEQASTMIHSIIRNATEACNQIGDKGWGNMPGELREQIELMNTDAPPVVPWEVVLREFISSASETMLDYTMRRPSKRYGTRPGTKKEDVLNLAIGIDTSGSVNNDMLQLFFKELYWIEKTGVKMTVFEWDTRVHREYDFKDFTGEIKGRGGTDPTDFLEKISERHFDCALVFTDLYFEEISDEYRLPTLWVVDNSMSIAEMQNATLPVDGTILKINTARDGFDLIQR